MIKRRRLGLAFVAMYALSIALAAQVAAAPRQTVSGVKSVTAITRVMTFGQKVSAIAVEYGSIVNPTPLQLNTFTVKDSWYDFRFDNVSKLDDVRDRTITRVYTNDHAATIDGGVSVPGKFVIIELSMLDYGGNTVMTNPTNSNYVKINTDMRTRVIQNKDVYAFTTSGNLGTPLGAGSTTAYKPTTWLDPLADQFIYGTFPGPNNVTLPYYYYIPAACTAEHPCPMVVIFPGMGMGYLPGAGANPKVNVVADIPATAWMQPAWIGSNEPVIVLAPQNQRVGADAEATAALGLMDQFIAAGNVNAKRLYFTTCSYGSTTAWAAMAQRPGFFASGLLTGGFAVSAAQATSIATARPLTPIYITHGLKDPLLRINTTGYTSRDRLRAAYVATGLVDAAGAEALLPFVAIDTPAYFNQVVPQVPGYAETDNHAVDGPTYADPNHTYTLWLLSQARP